MNKEVSLFIKILCNKFSAKVTNYADKKLRTIFELPTTNLYLDDIDLKQF